MRVLVCGGRTYGWFAGPRKVVNVPEYESVYGELDKYLIHEKLHIISGGAPGADSWAEEWARERQIPFTVYPAPWTKYGKSAGYIRNKQMLDEGKPDLVIAFPGGKGTAMMVDIARKAGVEVLTVPYP